MTTAMLIKKMEKEDLILIPRKKYEELLFREPRIVDEVPMTASEKRALTHARKELKQGKTLSFDEFSRKLALRNRH